jgi:hypothetical protein
MTIDATVTEFQHIDLPYGHTAKLQNVEYENGTKLLRITFRQDKRFTVLDIDAERADTLAKALSDWLKTTNI